MVQDRLKETVEFIRTRSQLKPRMGIVLGSGLGAFVDRVNVETTIPYDEIPSFNSPTVEGHQGRLILGKVGSTNLAILQGRIHYYEGHSMSDVVFPVRTLALLGTEIIMLTNSAGGLDPNMKPGDLYDPRES